MRINICFPLMLWLLLQLPGYSQPVSLNAVNPHYLQYKGKPALLVTSAEPYGAVLNLDFDFRKYLETLHHEGMNYTRIFSGSYVEIPGSFGIENWSLNPDPGKFIAPWVRTNQPGLYKGEGKFDFDKWNIAYFNRLHQFMRLADSLDIIVEMTFFCATYEDSYWERHPFNSQNNINNLGNSIRLEFNTSNNSRVFDYQKKLIEKLTTELNRYNNLFFELSNEPWSDYQERVHYLHKSLIPEEKFQPVLWSRAAPPATLEWQKQLAAVFRETEQKLPKKHLLAQNYSDMVEVLTSVDDKIDILNFHYAWPETATVNYGWNRPINNDETGFAGSEDSVYLKQAWTFLLAGGGIFNNLDYSFFVGKEDGSGKNIAPGGGSKRLRKQLYFLRTFLEKFSFVDMRPTASAIVLSPGMEGYCLATAGKAYALYFEGRNQGYVLLDLPPGEYLVNVFSPDDGLLLNSYDTKSSGKPVNLKLPLRSRIALQIVAFNKPTE